MKIIKVSSGSSRLTNLLLRQTPGSSGIWRDCRFVINQNTDACDAWFVLHHSGLIYNDQVFCDPSKVFYVSMEPYESIGNVSPGFIDQFGCAIGCDPDLASPCVISKNFHTWWAGINVQHRRNAHSFSPLVNLAYDDFVLLPGFSLPRLNRICCILSSKEFLEGHKGRLRLVSELADTAAGALIDFYGGIGSPFSDKYDVQSRYKYSLVLENSILPHYWSEKLADTFLASSFPLYLGCPNIADYFHPDSLIPLNGLTTPQVSDRLCFAVEKGIYEQSCTELERSKHSILNLYNIFNQMEDLVCSTTSASPKRLVCIKPNSYFTETTFQRLRRRLSSIKGLAKNFV